MKISIIGTNGLLSTAIGKYCNLKDYYINTYGLEKPTNHECNNFFCIDFINSDIDCLELLQSDMIVYCVGAGIQSNLKESADLIYNLNVTTPVKISNYLKSNNYNGIFVTFGSVFEIGETNLNTPFSEEDIMQSTSTAPSDYVISKRMLSRFVVSNQAPFKHWHFYIPTIYGKAENPLRLIPYTINAVRNNEDLHFTAGDQIRQYIHIDEIPIILDLSFQNNLKSGIYNIAGCNIISVKELVMMIHSLYGKSVPKDCFGSAKRTDVGMKYLALNGAKLKNAIGFEATTELFDALKEY
ncbi:MAG: NAD-dependent epimerase/dehydratase family protein [Rikenellaceae bacterium]